MEFYYDERALLPIDEALVLDIMDQGVLEPVLAIRKGGASIVIAGRQRVKAAREAKRRGCEISVPVIFKRGDELRILGMTIAEIACQVMATWLPEGDQGSSRVYVMSGEQDAAPGEVVLWLPGQGRIAFTVDEARTVGRALIEAAGGESEGVSA